MAVAITATGQCYLAMGTHVPRFPVILHFCSTVTWVILPVKVLGRPGL